MPFENYAAVDNNEHNPYNDIGISFNAQRPNNFTPEKIPLQHFLRMKIQIGIHGGIMPVSNFTKISLLI